MGGRKLERWYDVRVDSYIVCPQQASEKGCPVFDQGNCNKAKELGKLGMTLRRTVRAVTAAEARRSVKIEAQRSADDHEHSAGSCENFELLCDYRPEVVAPPILIYANPRVIKATAL